MSVVIKGMEIPEDCFSCPLKEEGFCNITKAYAGLIYGRNSDCPLIELPEHHGRLIDADGMCNDLATVDPRYETLINWCIGVTEAQPTVVEAENKN